MISRRGVVFGLAGAALSGAGVLAAEQSALDFLGGIYAQYKGKDAKGVPMNGYRELARIFTPSLARLIDTDRKVNTKRGFVPTLDGDPFVDAQDWDIDAFAIDVKDTANKAAGTVKFKNFTDNATVTLDLVKTKDGWRVDDISGPRRSLRALFKKK